MGNWESIPVLPPQITVEVGEKKPGETRVRRHYAHANELISLPFPDEPSVNTIPAIFNRAARLYAEHPCLGQRPIDANKVAGPYVFESYAEVKTKVDYASSALASLGLPAHASVSIFSINRPEWMIAALGLWHQGLTCVPLYDTLGASSTEFIVSHTELTTVFVSKAKIDIIFELAAKLKFLKNVIQFEALDDKQRDRAKELGINLWSLAEFLEIGKQNPAPSPLPSPDDLAYIMYTSGTTGDPKGVMLTHGNFVASASGILRTGIVITPSDSYFSFLPLAHSFETVMQVVGLCGGGSVGFYQGDVKKLMDDVVALRPTIFAGVPRVYCRIYDKVQQVISEATGIKKSIITYAFENQTQYVRDGERSAILDALVFNKIKDRLGGRVRIMATGAAPMPAHIMEFLKVAFGCQVLQGYGMTENAAAACVTPVGYRLNGTIGCPVPCVEVKLIDIPEMNYTSEDKPCPRGEIALKGSNVFKGYFKQEDKTKEAMTDDGWLLTGDVGQWNPDGSLSVIDRKKNIFKLAQGEFVAAEELENHFIKSPYVGQFWVYGNSFKTMVIAVVVPSYETVLPWAREQGIEGDFPSIASNPAVKRLLMDEIKRIGKSENIASFKVPKDIHIETEINELFQGFTMENDCLTPTFKLKRPQLLKKYQKEIDDLYQALGEGDGPAQAPKL